MQVAFLFVVLLASAYATPQVKGNPLSCFLCHSIVDQLVTDAGQNVTMKILTQAVTTVCSVRPFSTNVQTRHLNSSLWI